MGISNNIHNLSQGPPNPGFIQKKVQKGDFLKTDSRESKIFSCFRYLWISRRPGTLNWERVVFLPSKNLYRKCELYWPATLFLQDEKGVKLQLGHLPFVHDKIVQIITFRLTKLCSRLPLSFDVDMNLKLHLFIQILNTFNTYHIILHNTTCWCCCIFNSSWIYVSKNTTLLYVSFIVNELCA